MTVYFEMYSTRVATVPRVEGVRGWTETNLVMQVLFNVVYERAKATAKRAVFVIGEPTT